MTAANFSGIEPKKLRSFNQLKLEGLGTGQSMEPWHQFRGLVIEQSIYSPYIRTSLVLHDAASIFDTRLPILGEEKLSLKFEDASGKKVKLDSYITNVSPIEYHEGRKMVGYILEGKSEWAINNPRDKCRYTYEDTPYQDIASDVASKYLSKPFDSVDPTIEPPVRYYLQNLTPFQTLELLARKSWDGGPSLFTTHARLKDGKEEFHYKNVYKLWEQGPSWKFWVTDAVDEKRELDVRFTNGTKEARVEAIERTNSFNSTDLTLSGYDSRSYQHLDLYNKHITEVVDTGNRSSFAGKELQTEAFRSKYMSPQVTPENRRLYTMTDTQYNEDKYRDKFVMSQPFIQAMGQNEITLQTYGISDLNVGDTCDLQEVRIDGYEQRKLSKRYSGKWLITHKKDSIGFDMSYVSKFVLSRESVNFEIDEPEQPIQS